ncbi:WD repeat-containing protein 47 [Sarcoptes scabiei]|uniref:DUF5745 domain-containing protein n=1 Tax=Sarcoptes scabiei TaxID=52283 RepID=A0A131ZY48_SARSC|nr:hypothetical protein QR98_0018600 [Sarcoptes scabiei]UXI21220.1 WD repeat-containing protein 47 [Sarcoptes scabiei]
MATKQFSIQSSNVRYRLVDRINKLIEENFLPIPRFVTCRFIGYQFWSILFTKIFRIDCDLTVRQPTERIKMLASCLNTLESIVEVPLDHIQPEKLLDYDVQTITNLIEIAEFWCDFARDQNRFESIGPNFDSFDVSNAEKSNYSTFSRINYRSEPNIYERLHEKTSTSDNLASLLYKALKNQIIAFEIEKKIKMYLGDVTSKQSKNDLPLRASRQSIVRTRSIQPSATFDFQFTRGDRQNQILSPEFERWFPETSIEKLRRIRHLEQNLLTLYNANSLKRKQISPDLNDYLRCIVDRQRNDIELLDKEKTVNHQINYLSSVQSRTQRALVHDKINKFYRSSLAAYLNARSYLEKILVEEFRKVEINQRRHINDIRRYLKNHDEVELEKVRQILESIDDIF